MRTITPHTSAPAQGLNSSPRPAVTLRHALERLKTLSAGKLKVRSQRQYDTIVAKWETYHDGAGPCLSTVTSDELTAFFHAVPEWNSRKTWARCAAQIGKLFDSCCPRSRLNRYGMSTGALIRSREDVPFIEIPEDHWFRQNRTAGSARSGGHTPKRRGALTLDDYQRVIDACWYVCPNKSVATYMETCLGWMWFSGMRIGQMLGELQWSADGVTDGVHIDSRSLVTAESKCGGEINIPLPDALLPGLRILRAAAVARQGAIGCLPEEDQPRAAQLNRLVFYRPNYQIRAWRNLYAQLWDYAFPCATDTERLLAHWTPHQVRSVSVTTWDLLPPPACDVGWRITGHQPGSVRKEKYVKPSDADFRRIVNDVFPMPWLRAAD